MHAVVVRSTLHDFDQARQFLRGEVVPGVSQAPGFVTAHWVRLDESHGTSMLVFESEEAARAAAERIVPKEGVVTPDSIEIGEVVEHA
jgi:hypothetical protein